MPQIPIIMPQLGESIAEATIVSFLVKLGDQVEAGQDIIEVETNKANMNVASPCRGRIETFVAQLNESYAVGALLGQIEATQEEAARSGLDTPSPKLSGDTEQLRAAGTPSSAAGETRGVKPTIRGLPVPAHAAGASYMSPRMKARMDELGLHAADLSGIAGSGAAGRVTIQDFEKYIANLEKQKLTQASTMRVAVADAMRRSWTRPLATVGLPACLDAVLAHRKQASPKPGPALYALRALAIALAENSASAGRLVGSKIVHPSSIDVGFAVEAEDGVLVPVIRNADKKPLMELVKRYDELIEFAHQRKLPGDATGGSIATVTNFGTFGLTWATPIPLPEQTLVLGLGAGRKVPHWDEVKGQFVPTVEAYLTLSFDHRVLDGGAAGRLLTRIAGLLMQPEKL
jgi:pyruvate/2-oxoglutarate dehydrogenase complex dihydrolipoamide acyltransferase (E2) component